MTHNHNVVDTDTHYIIDSATREIANSFQVKKIIGQFDHKAERLTFEIPRYFDGHDFSKCNVAKVFYTNSDNIEKEKNSGEYTITDLKVKEDDENIVIFSWLVEMESTNIAGFLEFSISLQCVSKGEIEYSWNSAPYRLMVIKTRTVSDGISVIQIAIENAKEERRVDLKNVLEAMSSENLNDKSWDELKDIIEELSVQSFIEPMFEFFKDYFGEYETPDNPGGGGTFPVEPEIPIEPEGDDEFVTE